MERSTLELLEDAEDLMVDTRKRIGSCVDLETSLEVRGEDLTLAKKNMKEFEKIYVELMESRKIRQNTPEMQSKFQEVTNDYLMLQHKVKYMTKLIFGVDDFSVSSIIAPYSHFDCSRLYSSANELSSDWVSPYFENMDPCDEVKDTRAPQVGQTNFEEEKVEVRVDASTSKKRNSDVLDFDDVECSPIKKLKSEESVTAKTHDK